MKKRILSVLVGITTFLVPLKAQADTQVKDKWALVVGISQFEKPGMDLKYGAKDAQDFYNYLVKEAGFKPDHISLLLNKDATRNKIMSSFSDRFLPAVARSGDMVVVFISSRGSSPSEDVAKRSYFLAYDSDPSDLYSNGVEMLNLSECLRQRVQAELSLIVMNSDYSGNGLPQKRSRVDETAAQAQMPSVGQVVITSCAADEKSNDSTKSQNSVFTKYLLQALRKPGANVDLKAAFNEIKGNVSAEVKASSNKSQVPQLGGQSLGNFVLSAPASAPRQALLVPFSSKMEAGTR